MKKFLLAALLCLNLCAQNIVNGEAAIIFSPSDLAGNLSIDGKPAKWLDAPNNKKLKFALVVADYYKTGEIVVTNELNGKISKQIFKVIKGDYKQEKITAQSTKVTPPEEAMERIKLERDEANAVYATASSGLKFSSSFALPINSVVTSPFGTARVFNGTLKSYHGGADFRASVGSPVKAANDGIVVIAKDRYYAGGSVVIDHGEGIYTQYYHLSRIDARVNQTVKKGEIIGLSGQSGRINGPHLHFGVIANGAQINPLDFVKKINSVFKR